VTGPIAPGSGTDFDASSTTGDTCVGSAAVTRAGPVGAAVVAVAALGIVGEGLCAMGGAFVEVPHDSKSNETARSVRIMC